MSYLYNYDLNVDAKNDQSTNKELVALLNIDAQGNTRDYELNHVLNDAWPGGQETLVVNQVLQGMEARYMEMLSQIQLINNLTNLTSFAHTTFKTENARMNQLRERTINDVYKMRSGYMNTQWKIGYDKYAAKILKVTIIMVCIAVLFVAFSLQGTFGWAITGTALGLLVTFYLIVIVLMYRSMVYRRKDDWTKFYFNPPKNV